MVGNIGKRKERRVLNGVDVADLRRRVIEENIEATGLPDPVWELVPDDMEPGVPMRMTEEEIFRTQMDRMLRVDPYESGHLEFVEEVLGYENLPPKDARAFRAYYEDGSRYAGTEMPEIKRYGSRGKYWPAVGGRWSVIPSDGDIYGEAIIESIEGGVVTWYDNSYGTRHKSRIMDEYDNPHFVYNWKTYYLQDCQSLL